MTQRLKQVVTRALGRKRDVHVDNELLVRYVAKCLTSEAVYVEMGAFTGLTGKWVQQLASLRPDNCHLVEACPTNYEIMKQHCPGFRLYNFAVADREGTLPFYVVDRPIDEGTSRSNSFDRDHLVRRFGEKNVKEIPVRALSVNAFLKEAVIPEIDFLFFNIEGAEYHVFKGDSSFLDKVRFFYLDLHHRPGHFKTLKSEQTRIYDQIASRGFKRIGGHLKEHIPVVANHLTFLWERQV